MRILCFIFMAILLYNILNSLIKRLYNMLSNKLSINIFGSIFAVLIMATSLTSCRNNDDDGATPEEKMGYAEDQLLLEHIYNNVDRVVEVAFQQGQSGLKGESVLASCATVTDDTVDALTRQMVIDFGNAPCLGFDGRYRTGKIIVVYSRDKVAKENGYFQRITFSNHFMNGYRVMGVKEMNNVTGNGSAGVQYEVTRIDTVIMPEGEGRLTGKSERQRAWWRGANTPQTSDDIYRLTGSGFFRRVNGDTYNIQIAEPLILPVDCNWITEGVINIYPSDATKRILDYGDDGQCEDVATLNINGKVSTLQIP